ncbi:cobalamin biosynthesis protein CbiG [Desulfopila sp. IMCC35006]|uniref:cobalt-precorrin 5A hydrolase n=1 Tax=Desulfopila sp. IMCC35006 TaxID=2569542 RepID=UPI0010ACC412|nr:cobalamin biosynthesis protein [Desulfopila sp. IMCC35006]TKB26617.1 cobalamin biosynthesis protein CbiG [Desulfopila sp. IMCC35006]
MKIGIVAITSGGRNLAGRLGTLLDDATVLLTQPGAKVADTIGANWHYYDGFICIMAAGIVVRAIAPLLGDKLTDPCVVVLDEKGSHAISLLAGHVGGGNTLAEKVAALTGGTAVITTASDTLGLVALDLWAKEQQLAVPDRKVLTSLSTLLVNQGHLSLYTEMEVSSLPKGLRRVDDALHADFIVSRATTITHLRPVFRPRDLVVGIGCNRGTPGHEFEDALTELFNDLHLSRASIRNLASIDKKNDETGLLQFAENNCWPIDFYDSDTINRQTNLEISFAALGAVGAIGVAEPTALLSAQSNHLLSRKRKWKNVTMAVAQAPFTLSAQVPAQSKT